MKAVKCPHCEAEIPDTFAAGSSRIHAAHTTEEKIEGYQAPIFEVILSECLHCGKKIQVVMLDQRW